jgi:hypothetical protein
LQTSTSAGGLTGHESTTVAWMKQLGHITSVANIDTVAAGDAPAWPDTRQVDSWS